MTAALPPGHADLVWLACDALESLDDRPEEAELVMPAAAAPIFDAAGRT